MRHSQFLASVPGPNNQNQHMSLKHEQLQAVAASAPEPMKAVMGKVGVVWVGFFAGISLGDWVLIATLTYTLIQIALTLVERVIKPILAVRRPRQPPNSQSAD